MRAYSHKIRNVCEIRLHLSRTLYRSLFYQKMLYFSAFFFTTSLFLLINVYGERESLPVIYSFYMSIYWLVCQATL